MAWTVLLHQGFVGSAPTPRGRSVLILWDWLLVLGFVAWGSPPQYYRQDVREMFREQEWSMGALQSCEAQPQDK